MVVVVTSEIEVMLKQSLSLGTDSRKIAVFVPVFAASCVYLYFGKIASAEWVELSKWSIMTLFATLTAERFGTAK